MTDGSVGGARGWQVPWGASRIGALAILLWAVAAQAAPGVSVLHAWSRPTPPGATVGVAFFEVHDDGPGDVLVGLETPRASRVEMHDSHVVDGVMQMRQTDAVPLPSHATVVFAPGGLHAMLLGLRAPLRAGERIPLTLTLRSGARISFEAVVREQDEVAAPPSATSSDRAQEAPQFRLAQWPAHLEAPDFKLEDIDGAPRTMADYRGRVVMVFFGFTHCPDLCPAGLLKLAQVVKQLGELRDRVQVLFITLDPRRDVPADLRRYVQAFDPQFVALTGSDAAVDAAAASFHVEYAKVSQGKDYTIDHSGGVFVLDGAGRLQLVGSTTTSTADFVHDLARLAER